jgi:(2Fe-2S) ferredoxin
MYIHHCSLFLVVAAVCCCLLVGCLAGGTNTTQNRVVREGSCLEEGMPRLPSASTVLLLCCIATRYIAGNFAFMGTHHFRGADGCTRQAASKVEIDVCFDGDCSSDGSSETLKILTQKFDHSPRVEVQASGCIGCCGLGPTVRLRAAGEGEKVFTGVEKSSTKITSIIAMAERGSLVNEADASDDYAEC